MLQKSITFLISLFLLISLTACSDDDDDETSLSDFPLEELLDDNISFMGFFTDRDMDEIQTEVSIFILEEHENVSLSLNGNEIELNNFFGFYFADVDIMPGSSVDYNLTIDNTSRSGNITISNLPSGNFPSAFDLSQNYSFSWTISASPQAFIAYLGIEDSDDWHETFAELPGSARNHTFNRDLYSSFDTDDLWYIDVGILSVNFEVNDGLLIFSGSDSYKEYEFSGSSFQIQSLESDEKMPSSKFLRNLRR